MAKEWADLIGHFAWPITILVLFWIFRDPISSLIQMFSTRITAISAFRVKIQLGQLSSANTLSVTLERLSKVASVDRSQVMTIASEFIKSARADYVTIDIGENSDEWLTSRLFLLSALLERSWNVRCIVFLQGGRFVGAATPRDVRSALSMFFLNMSIRLQRHTAS